MDYFYEDEKEDWRGCLWNLIYTAVWICVIASCLFFCTGCTTTKYVTVPEYHTDTLIVNHTQRDSIYIQDSTHVSEKQQGDTLVIRITKWKTRFQDRAVHDTIYQRKVDTIPKPYPVEVKVPRELTWWQRLRLHLGNIMLALIGMAVLYGAAKLYLKFKPI